MMPREKEEQSRFATDIDDLFMTMGEDTVTEVENAPPTEPNATAVLDEGAEEEVAQNP